MICEPIDRFSQNFAAEKVETYSILDCRADFVLANFIA